MRQHKPHYNCQANVMMNTKPSNQHSFKFPKCAHAVPRRKAGVCSIANIWHPNALHENKPPHNPSLLVHNSAVHRTHPDPAA